MAGPHGDLFRSRAGGDPQRHRRMPKVVDAQSLKTGCLGGRDPEARPETPDPQRSPAGCGEDVAVWAPLCCEMRLELADDEGRQPRAPSKSRFAPNVRACLPLDLAPVLDRRGRVASAHDVGPSDEWDKSRL